MDLVRQPIDTTEEPQSHEIDFEKTIDLKHLEEFCSGDRQFTRSLLKLFATESKSYLDQLNVTQTINECRKQVHLIKSSAGGIGAGKIVRTAAAALELDEQDFAQKQTSIVSQLTKDINEVNAFIKAYVKQA